jgi:hypothetical protein
VGKGREAGVQGQNALLPPLARIQDRGRGVGRRRPAGLAAEAADGERGKRKRAMRGFFSLPHLGLGCDVESAPREETMVVMGSRWWLDVAVR